MSTIFVSYDRKSEAGVRVLARDLEALGHRVGFDRDVSGGQPWWDEILEKVRNCDIFLFALCPESLASTACNREFRYAADLGKPVLPVHVAGEVSKNLLPPALAALEVLDYRNLDDRDTAIGLSRAINRMPVAGPLPDPLPEPPEIPISHLGGLAEKIGTSATLSRDEQIVVLADLKRGLRDRETADDTRALMERLRARQEIAKDVAEELDEVLERQKAGSRRGRWPTTKVVWGGLAVTAILVAVLIWQYTTPAHLEILNPANGASIGPGTPTFSWRAHPEATTYSINLRRTRPSGKHLDSARLQATRYTSSVPLKPGASFILEVTAHGGDNRRLAKGVTRFRVE